MARPAAVRAGIHDIGIIMGIGLEDMDVLHPTHIHSG